MNNLLRGIRLLSQNKIEGKRVLLRVDFNVPLTEKQTVADGIRIIKSLPTIELLLKQKNKVILVSHLGRPNGREHKFSLKPVVLYLQKLLSKKHIILIEDFLSGKEKLTLQKQTANDIVLLENIRFYPGEKINDDIFAQKLSQLGTVYVNDAFGVSHRDAASVVGITRLLPSYAGLLLEKEIRAIQKLMQKPQKPVVAIIGGAKISTKIILLSKLLDVVDYLLLGGGIANAFLQNQEPEITQKILNLAKKKNVSLLLPIDTAGLENKILDIGPRTAKAFTDVISKAKTIVWNGPVGLVEDKRFAKGTNAIFRAVVNNKRAFSLVGGGDTLASVSGNKDLDKITHVSTGGGAMLELIEKGTLPGIEALRRKSA
ncbi:MAG: phosphoglycerate kinase [Candidatus Levybacteria bacterium]|nr:phosphoglycerate kinase [Candidatus Levybacteria bacterium]